MTVQVQEVENTRQCSTEKTSNHVVLLRKAAWDMATKHGTIVKSFVKLVAWIPTYVATSLHWHAVIPCVGMTLFDGMIMVQNAVICMRRMGVG